MDLKFYSKKRAHKPDDFVKIKNKIFTNQIDNLCKFINLDFICEIHIYQFKFLNFTIAKSNS
ncbi:MAG: hypothetical protein EBT63_05970 [Proteobacteria bacterium]|nr:hypothetical protein [Pseudomonadota bacterium]NCA28073.1 hypothetical protein [Pseudomonadota bacterium]